MTNGRMGPRLLLLTVVLLAAALLAGCRGGGDGASPVPLPDGGGVESVNKGTNAAGGEGGGGAAEAEPDALEWTQDTSPFTFTQYFYGTWATNYLWQDQYAMKLVTEKTGVTIDRFLATGNDNDYLNTMIASGDLPDTIMLDWNNPLVTKLINSGMVYAISDLIREYAPKFEAMLDPEMVKYHSVDGKLWYLPNLYEPPERLETGIPVTGIRPWFVRKDIYEALGSPPVDTPERMEGFLKAAKAAYPDLVPLGMQSFDVARWGFQGSLSMDYLIYAYSPNLNQNRIRDDLAKVLYPMRDPGFKEAFRYVNRLNREGVFDAEQLITKEEQYEEKVNGARFIVPSAFRQDMYVKFNPRIAETLDAGKTYQVLDGLKANGKEPRYPGSRLMGWQGFFITKKAANPERIIKFLEYAWSDEGQLDFRYGKLGETYDMVDGLPKAKPEIKELELTDNAAWYKRYGFTASTLMWHSGKLWDEAEKRDFMAYQPEQYEAAKLLEKYNYDYTSLGLDNIEPEGSSLEGTINAKIKDLWNKTIPRLILAGSNAEFDAVYADFLQVMDSMDAGEAEKVMYERHLLDLRKKGIEPQERQQTNG